jgi:Rod binding domain-containing protein
MRVDAQDPTRLLAAQALAGADPAPTRDASKRLEGLFATLLVKEMRTTQTAGFFGEGTGADVYSGWLDQVLGEALAKHGELHLADGIENSLAKKQEEQKP